MGRKLTDNEKQERRLKREATKRWRRELCVELANKAVEANHKEEGIPFDYLSPPFLLLIKPYL